MGQAHVARNGGLRMAAAVLATVLAVRAEVVVTGWEADDGLDLDEWGLPAFYERKIKVQHLSPAFGRYEGGLLVNVTGKGPRGRRAGGPHA